MSGSRLALLTRSLADGSHRRAAEGDRDWVGYCPDLTVVSRRPARSRCCRPTRTTGVLSGGAGCGEDRGQPDVAGGQERDVGQPATATPTGCACAGVLPRISPSTSGPWADQPDALDGGHRGGPAVMPGRTPRHDASRSFSTVSAFPMLNAEPAADQHRRGHRPQFSGPAASPSIAPRVRGQAVGEGLEVHGHAGQAPHRPRCAARACASAAVIAACWATGLWLKT